MTRFMDAWIRDQRNPEFFAGLRDAAEQIFEEEEEQEPGDAECENECTECCGGLCPFEAGRQAGAAEMARAAELMCRVRNVYRNGAHTVLEFEDGAKVRVTLAPGDECDEEKALMAGMLKRLTGNGYLKVLRQYGDFVRTPEKKRKKRAARDAEEVRSAFEMLPPDVFRESREDSRGAKEILYFDPDLFDDFCSL